MRESPQRPPPYPRRYRTGESGMRIAPFVVRVNELGAHTRKGRTNMRILIGYDGSECADAALERFNTGWTAR